MIIIAWICACLALALSAGVVHAMYRNHVEVGLAPKQAWARVCHDLFYGWPQ